jgi:TRAP-type C4-dicarboxylate transport system substrate-binding protein
MNARSLAAAMALALAVAAGCQPDSARAEELKLAHFMPPGHTLHRQVFAPLAEDLSRATGGALTLAIFPAGELGKGPAQQYKRALEGVADITFCIQSYTAELVPRSLLATLPGVARSAEEGTRRVWEIYARHLQEEYRDVKLLGLWVMSPTILIGRARPVGRIADLRGIKVRISSPNESDLIQAWGAVPVAMPITESYSALNSGIVDAVLIQPSALYRPWNLAEPAKTVSDNLPSPTSMVCLVMNRQRWEALPPELRNVIDRLTGRAFSIQASALWAAEDREALEQAARDPRLTFVRLAPDEREAFAQAARPAVERELQRLERRGIAARQIYDALIAP